MNEWADYFNGNLIKIARQKFEDNSLLEAFGIIFLELEDVMNGWYKIHGERRHEKSFFDYKKIVELLFNEEYMDEDTKSKLCRFKSTRVEITHYLLPSSFGRRPPKQLTPERIRKDFEMGIELHGKIYEKGEDSFVDAYNDLMESGFIK